MKFNVIQTQLDGRVIEDYGVLNIEQVRFLARNYIPEVFDSEEAVNKAIVIIQAEGADDWFISGPAIINIRRVDE